MKELASTCVFGDLAEDLIRDKLILGIKEVNIKDKLLSESNLNLEKALEICKIAETTSKQIQSLSGKSDEQVEEVNMIRRQARQASAAHSYQNRATQKQNGYYNDRKKTKNMVDNHKRIKLSNDRNKYINNCNKCKSSHLVGKCAFGKQCMLFKKMNHFKRACRQNNVNVVDVEGEYEDDYSDDELNTLLIGNLNKFKNCRINNEIN